jgi:hypothetical protein
MFDYLLNVLLIFPALCIYDANILKKKAQGQLPNCCMTLNCCVTGNEEAVAEMNVVIQNIIINMLKIKNKKATRKK